MGDGGHKRTRLAARYDTSSHTAAIVSEEKVAWFVGHLQAVAAASPVAWASMQRDLDRRRSANGGQRYESPPAGRHLIDVLTDAIRHSAGQPSERFLGPSLPCC
jgi:hypothetical protein